MTVSNQTSQKIRNLSLLCSILVVTIHVEWPIDRLSGRLMHELVANGIARMAVPFFFIVSGFFFAGHFNDNDWWKRELVKRMGSLGVPYVTWSLINLILALPLCIVADMIAHRDFGTSIYWMHGHNWVNVFGLDLTRGPDLGPLWYVRTLLIFALFGKVFKRTILAFPVLWLCCMFLLDMSCRYFPESVRDYFMMGMRFGGVATGLFYFSVGTYIRLRNSGGDDGRMATASLVIGILLLIVKTVFSYRHLPMANDILQLALPFLIYGVWHYAPSWKIPTWLTQSAFPIYLMNIIFVTYMNTFLKHVVIDKTMAAFCVFFVATATPVIVSYAFRRFSPRIYGILFGGR